MNLLNKLSSSVELPDLALKTSWFLVPEPIKMIYRPQRRESGQGGVKRQGEGSWSCHQHRWHV
jgi:hypothetical protein